MSKLSNFYNGENTSLRKEDGMRVEPKHIFTGGAAPIKGVKVPDLEDTFKGSAPINMRSRSLHNRVVKPESVTKRGVKFTKEVGEILKKIPSPFLTKGSSTRGS